MVPSYVHYIRLTLGVHAQRGLLYLVCMCVCLSVMAIRAPQADCLSLTCLCHLHTVEASEVTRGSSHESKAAFKHYTYEYMGRRLLHN